MTRLIVEPEQIVPVLVTHWGLLHVACYMRYILIDHQVWSETQHVSITLLV